MEHQVSYKKTYFLDIDGTLLTHHDNCGGHENQILTKGALEFVNQLKKDGHFIVITTSRPYYMLAETRKQLYNLGIQGYNTIISDLPRGERIVINDQKPNMKTTAIGITVVRDKGLDSIELYNKEEKIKQLEQKLWEYEKDIEMYQQEIQSYQLEKEWKDFKPGDMK